MRCSMIMCLRSILSHLCPPRVQEEAKDAVAALKSAPVESAPKAKKSFKALGNKIKALGN